MESSSVTTTREVAHQWFTNLEQGKFEEALSLVHEDVLWENIPPTPGVSDLAPWLGSYRGLPDVKDSFDVWSRYSQMLSFKPLDVIVEGDRALGIVHEHAQCLANQNEYDLYVATYLRIADGKIVHWKVYWDPSPLIRAYRDL